MWVRADDAAYMPAVVNSFNASHKDIQLKLTLVPQAQLGQKYSAAASGGPGPDIVAVEISTMPQFDRTGWLVDLTNDAKQMSYYDKFSPAHLNQATYDGKLYAVPFTGDVSALFYNKDLFKQAGLDPDKPPTTWAEIQAYAAKIHALGPGYYGYFFSGACGGCMSFTMLPYVWAGGGDVLKSSGNTTTPKFYPNPDLASALELYRNLWKSGQVPTEAQTENGADQFGPFFNGKVGMFVQGTFPAGLLRRDHTNINWGLAPVPNADGTASASFAGGDDLAITKKANKAKALEVLKWMTTQGQTELAKLGVLPTRSDIANTDYTKLDPRNEVFVKALGVGHTPQAVKVSAVLFDNNSPWATLLQEAIFGSGSIDGAMRKAQEAATQVLSN
jgi:multiple sugar transport system substrate-binding protein